MPKNKFKGTGVALVTPFRKDGSIDFSSLEKLIEHTISNGVNYLVALGTTGETATLTNDEKNAVLNFIVDINNKRVPLVVGFGGNNTQEVINNIKSCEISGIDAILSVSPYYNKPSQKGLYQHYKAIANASPYPVIIYNVPGRTGSNISAETTLKLANDIDNIIAIKEASANFDQIMQIIKNKPKDFLVLSGDDGLTLPLISLGMSGVISVAANAFPKEMCEIVDNALKNNYKIAREHHYKLVDIIDMLFIEGNPAGVKAALNILDITPNNLRLPLTPVSRTTYNTLAKHIEELQ